jgi:cysteine desulfurase
MLANNEIGVLQPLAEISRLCREREILLHTDATQAVGRVPVNVEALGVDLLSFSAHKIYGPKGIGALYVRRSGKPVRLVAQIDGGGQEHGMRSGTLNVPGIIGFAKALELCHAEMPTEMPRLHALRDRLFTKLVARIERIGLNGPQLDKPDLRLPNNLNVHFADVDGEALMLSMRDLAVSSGSACTSTNPEPSHVLRALGLSSDLTRSSLRFGLGRFNTGDEVDFAVNLLAEAVQRLRNLAHT